MDESMRRRRRAPGELEDSILRILWSTDRPLSPAEIHAQVSADLAYSTVHTILTRLLDKGLIIRVARRGRSGYTPVKDAAQSAADEMREVLDNGGERAAILTRFVRALTAADESVLRAVLDAKRRRKP